MNHEHGPLTSFEEDVKVLGLGHLFEDGTPPAFMKKDDKADKSDDKSDKDDDSDDDKDDKKPAFLKKKDDAEESEESDDEVQSEEDGDGDGDEDDADDESDDDSDKDAEEQEAPEGESAEEDEQVDPAFASVIEADEKLVAAVDVIGSLYEHLNESEDPSTSVDRESLVGVVEAFEYVTEQFGLLDEMRKFRIRHGKKKRITRGQKKKAQQGHEGGVNRMKFTPSGKKVRKTPEEIRAEKRASRFLGAGKASKGGGSMRRARSMKKSKRLASDETHEGQTIAETSPLAELIQNINGLKEAVKGNVDYRRQAEELKEGFNSIGETANTWMGAIAEEVKKTKTEDKDYDPEQDARVVMGRHLDGIAESAALIINKLDEGEADLEEASTDLAALAADLQDAAEAMKKIE